MVLFGTVPVALMVRTVQMVARAARSGAVLVSGAQAVTALGTPILDDAPATHGLHACTKPMTPFTYLDTGLECSFHLAKPQLSWAEIRD